MIQREPFEQPTVGLFVEVPEDDACRSGSWHWIKLDGVVPGREYVYSKRDLYRALVSYGPLVAYTLKVVPYPQFRIMARGLFTMRFLAEYVWHWSAQEGRFVPWADPWIVWPPLNELPEAVRKGAKRTGQLPGDEPGE